MQNGFKKNPKSEGKKNFTIVLMACFLCLSALAVGTVMIKNTKDNKSNNSKDIVSLNENPEKKTTKTDELAVNGQVSKDSQNKDCLDETTTDISLENNPTTTAAASTIETPAFSVTDAKTEVLAFNENCHLSWPIEGNIILDFSMDNTIYFPTLDSYKCNPAIVIQGDVGEAVRAGAIGIVNEISENEEYGKYIVLDLGSGYSLTYGQLDNITVTVGEMIDVDTSIATLAAPTRYYSKEGPNLYLMMCKNNEPCNPIDFLS